MKKLIKATVVRAKTESYTQYVKANNTEDFEFKPTTSMAGRRGGVWFRLQMSMQGLMSNMEYIKHLFDEGEFDENEAYEIYNTIREADRALHPYVN